MKRVKGQAERDRLWRGFRRELQRDGISGPHDPRWRQSRRAMKKAHKLWLKRLREELREAYREELNAK